MQKILHKQRDYDSSWYLLNRLYIEHVAPQRHRLVLAIFCMVVVAATTAISAWLMQPVLDSIFFNKTQSMLYLIPCAMLVNSFVKGVASFYESAIMKRTGQKIVTDIQLRLYSHLVYADTNFLNEHSSGNLISRLTNDINAMRKSVSDVFTGVAKELLTLVALIAIMLYQSFDLALIAILIFPICFHPMIKLSRRMRKISRKMQEELGGFTVRLDETFQHAGLVKSYCREEYEISRATKIIETFLSLFKRAAYIESAPSPIMEMLGGIAIAGIILYGGAQVIAGETTPGAFFSLITALLMAYRPMKAVSQLNNSLQEGLAASKRLFVMLDEKPKITYNATLPEAKFSDFSITFNHVHFSYKNQQKILEDFTLHIPQGKTVALVGESGVGKTTILQLIQRLYDADSGEVLIGGQSIKKVRLHSLRNNIALVSQEIALFDETILDNIRYGRLEATEQEVINAAMAAAAHDFIQGFSDGYHTKVGQQGVKLSGGQRQRIAIARAILKNAPILLLDEATSALDAISEKQVQMALEYLKKGRTTIVIAHRLSSIESADMICLISNGQVAETGAHSELLQHGGAYTMLYQQYKNSGNE